MRTTTRKTRVLNKSEFVDMDWIVVTSDQNCLNKIPELSQFLSTDDGAKPVSVL